MPDITMCMNDECHLAKECYRHEATPSDWQSYGMFKPNADGTCKHFMPIFNRTGENLQSDANEIDTNRDSAKDI